MAMLCAFQHNIGGDGGLTIQGGARRIWHCQKYSTDFHRNRWQRQWFMFIYICRWILLDVVVVAVALAAVMVIIMQHKNHVLDDRLNGINASSQKIEMSGKKDIEGGRCRAEEPLECLSD